MKKKLIPAIVVLVVLIVIKSLLGNLNGMVKDSIENIGTDLLGVPVTVESVNIELKEGMGEIKGIRIENPEGYQEKYAFEMKLIRLAIDAKSMAKSLVLLNDITIDSPEIFFETKDDERSNLSDLLLNIEKQSSSNKSSKKKSKKDDSSADSSVKLAVKMLVFKGVSLHLIQDKEKPKKITLPELQLNDIGGKEGVTPDEFGKYFISNVLGEVVKGSLKDALSKKFGNVKDGFLGALKGALN